MYTTLHGVTSYNIVVPFSLNSYLIMDQNKTPNFAENLMPYNIMKFILELISHYIKYYLCP
jgi:hypothetical protein